MQLYTKSLLLLRMLVNKSIEVSIIGDNRRNLLPRHSGEGRNPACQILPRSGQSLNGAVVPRGGAMSSAWIPAFAAMTVVLKFCVMNYEKINK